MRTSKRNRNVIRWLQTLLLTAAAVFGMTVGAAASEVDRMPDLIPGEKGLLKVTMTYLDPNVETDNVRIMPGVTVKLAKVADLAMHGGSADYTLAAPFDQTGIELAGMTASQSNEAALVMAKLASGDAVTSAVTGSDGAAVFADLEPGMYLVFQEEAANTEYRVDAIASMLLAVPFPQVGQNGNTWQYTVEAKPKTELPGPRDNGVIRVTKRLVNLENGLTYNPPENQEIVFYVGLFTDEACTARAEGTTDLPLKFLNSDSSTVAFENLKTDQTYYVAETDGRGNAVSSVMLLDEVIFAAQYPEGQTVSITRQNPEGALTFQNATTGLPVNFYYGGELTITKKTVMDGKAYPSDDSFYAALFEDAAHKKPIGTVVELKMDGKSSVSVTLEVNIGKSEKDSATYYIAETDRDGRPLQKGDGLEFTISMNKEEGKVTLSPAEPEDEVIITNTFAGEEEVETEIETEEEQKTYGGRTPRTGDETPVLRYVLLMAAALLILIIVWIVSRRKRR